MFISGHMTMMVTDGAPDAQQAAYYSARAEGGVGLIVTEAAAVHPSGLRSGKVIDASTDACIGGYAGLVEACAPHGVPLIGQLFHPGREMARAADGSRMVSFGPSAVPSERRKSIPRPMTDGMISEVISAYGDAARRLERAGLIGTEILASMGYLLSSFLNPRTNQREDAYGGNADNRRRIITDIIADIRAKTGADHVLGLRLSLEEFSHDGLTADGALEICDTLAASGGLDYVSVIGGSSTDAGGATHIVPPMSVEPGYLAPLAAQLKTRINLPVFVTGRINQPHVAEDILAKGQADMCGMTRAHICDPEIGNKSHSGDTDAIRACIGCNQACIGHEMLGYPISCIQRPETGRERTFGTMVASPQQKKIYIAGAGPAGLKAAITAYRRGHEVTLFDPGVQIGGQVRLAQTLPGRTEFGGLITNLAHELGQCAITPRLGEALNREIVERDAPDVVISATGSTPYWPMFETDEDMSVVDAPSVLTGAVRPGHCVLVADLPGDWTGIGVAEHLRRVGHDVTLATTCAVPGEALQAYVRDEWNACLHDLGVAILPYARLFGTSGDTAFLQHVVNGAAIPVEGVDTLVIAYGTIPDTSLEDSLSDWTGTVLGAGDCLSPRTAEEAVLEGLTAAWSI